MLHNIFFSFVVEVKTTLHPVFRFFFVLGPIIDVYGILTMSLSVFSELGACLFSLAIY